MCRDWKLHIKAGCLYDERLLEFGRRMLSRARMEETGSEIIALYESKPWASFHVFYISAKSGQGLRRAAGFHHCWAIRRIGSSL